MNPLNIIVCLKQIPDPEGPTTAYSVDREAKQLKTTGLPPVINPFDENALEAALKLKDQFGAKITILSMGEKLSKPILIKALGTGADDLILLEDTGFQELDSYSTATVLSSAIKKIGTYDLVLVGRQAGDWDSGQTAGLVAGMLHIPVVNLVVEIQVEEDSITATRLRKNGTEVVRVARPVVISADSQIGSLRFPSMKDLMVAKKKKPQTWKSADLGLDSQKLVPRNLYQLTPPQSMFRQCNFVEGETLEQKSGNLVARLRQESVV